MRPLVTLEMYPVCIGRPGISIRTFGSRLASTAACSTQLALLLQSKQVRHIAMLPTLKDFGGTCSSVTAAPCSASRSVKEVKQIGHLSLPILNKRSLCCLSVRLIRFLLLPKNPTATLRIAVTRSDSRVSRS